MSVDRVIVNDRELTAFDLPPEPSDEYVVSVDGLGEVTVRKGEPPSMRDVPGEYMRKMVPALCEQNARLRELVDELWALAYGYAPMESELDAARDMMRDLGIEVNS